MHILIPKRSCISARLKSNDEDFVDFIKKLVEVDQNLRPTANEALKHRFLSKVYE